MAREPKEINGVSTLTLHGSSEADGSIPFSHPRLDLVTGEKRMGREGGRGGEKEKGRFETMAEIFNGACSLSKSQISLCQGSSRSHETATPPGHAPPVNLVQPYGIGVNFHSQSDAQSRFASCCIHLSRWSVLTLE